MSDMNPTVRSTGKFSPIWIIPLVALAIGLWMVVQTKLSQGPTVTIVFQTAAGLAVGETKVKLLDVEIGLLTDLSLDDQMSSVIATVELDKSVKKLLREDTQFWVVRARIGADSVSGIETILSGAYIEIAPGEGKEGRKSFIGLEVPPLTPVGSPGIRVSLFSDRASSVSTGNPVLFNGYKVGRVEATDFDSERIQVRYDLFIDAPYDQLVTSSVRFWNVSGVSLKASAQGIEVNTGSLETIVLGGVAFAIPPGLPKGAKVEEGEEFKLYDSYEKIQEQPYRYRSYYAVLFDQSLRGLVIGAPVEYRGIQIGNVHSILFKEIVSSFKTGAEGQPIPVLISLEPGRLGMEDTRDSVQRMQSEFDLLINNGLRASLETGNLLTGSLYVNVEFYPEEDVIAIASYEGFNTIPTISTGLGRLEKQFSDLLEKLNSLPLENTVEGANNAVTSLDTTLKTLAKTLGSVDAILDQDSTRQLTQELSDTLAGLQKTLSSLTPNGASAFQSLSSSVNELNRTLSNLEKFTRTIADKPNALVLPAIIPADPIPEASTP